MRRLTLAVLVAVTAVLMTASVAFAQDYGTDTGTDTGGDSGNESSGSGGENASYKQPNGDITLWKNEKFGKIITDANGVTLYAFTPDKGGTPTCYDACEKAWPVFWAKGGKAEGGLNMELGSVKRKDGKSQATYNDWPLYYFAADQGKKGWTKGQGVQNKWYVLDDQGKLIKGDGGNLPFTGPGDMLLPLGAAFTAGGLLVLYTARRRITGRHQRARA